MADTYIQLVNKLRNRFNEVALTSGTWSSTIGFDQMTKEAINYAYHDILNAEMEWPFLHVSTTLKITPGVQFYTPVVVPAAQFTSPVEVKQIDYESFYIRDNNTRTSVTNEAHTISSSSPYTVTPTNLTTWQANTGVTYTSSGLPLTPVTGDPAVGEYTIFDRVYYFNSTEAGTGVNISYVTETEATQASIIDSQYLPYIDYDLWRQTKLSSEISAKFDIQAKPQCIFKTNNLNEIGFSPVPDKIYYIIYEYWVDALDLSATTDTPLIPTHYNQIIIDGAQKYCYEFREDPQLAATASKRFDAGVARMRIELINRRDDMKTGFQWPKGTYSFSASNNFR